MTLSLLASYIGYGVVFVVMISILVAAHEFGHYLFARMFDMGVEEFAIGVGKGPLLTWMRRSYILPIRPGEDPDIQNHAPASGGVGGLTNALEGGGAHRFVERLETPNGPALRETTEFTVRPLPVGGFVRIKGMLPEEDGSEVRIPGGFYSKPPWQRFLVLLAGPLFSVLAGVFVLIPVFMAVGDPKQVNEPVLGAILPQSAADKAGLKKGDQVLAVNGHSIENFYSMVSLVRNSNGAPLHFDLRRGGKELHATVSAERDKTPTPVMGPDLELTKEKTIGYKIGVRPPTVTVPVGFAGATQRSLELPFIAVERVIETFETPKDFSENVGGPVTMVQETADAVQSGFWQVLQLAGLLSISVGVFNLLPAHPLDGGQMMMAVAEMLRGGRRLSLRAQVIAGGIGLTFVAALVLSVFFVDIRRITTSGSKSSTPSATATSPINPPKKR